MAKKRVHELAKQYDMPLPEVMKRLNAYGLNVKAAASAVDESEADRALTGKSPKKADNGAGKQQQQQQRKAPATTGMGFDRPASKAAQEAREKRIAEERVWTTQHDNEVVSVRDLYEQVARLRGELEPVTYDFPPDEPDPFPVGTRVDVYEVPGGYVVARTRDHTQPADDGGNTAKEET